MRYEGRHVVKFNRQKIIRLEAGYTHQDVVKLLGLKSPRLLSRWENGDSMPSLENLFKLSIIYRRLPNDLYWDLYCDLRDEIRKREKKLALRRKKQNEKNMQ